MRNESKMGPKSPNGSCDCLHSDTIKGKEDCERSMRFGSKVEQ